jgi:hypothetical protein
MIEDEEQRQGIGKQIEVWRGRWHEWTSSCPRRRGRRWDRIMRMGGKENTSFQDDCKLVCRLERGELWKFIFSVIFFDLGFCSHMRSIYGPPWTRTTYALCQSATNFLRQPPFNFLNLINGHLPPSRFWFNFQRSGNQIVVVYDSEERRLIAAMLCDQTPGFTEEARLDSPHPDDKRPWSIFVEFGKPCVRKVSAQRRMRRGE